MKLVFLDFDGVLAPGYRECKRSNSINPVYSNEWYAETIDPVCVKWLNFIIEKAQAKIVVSSAWRSGKPIEKLQGILDAAGFKGKVIGKTRTGGGHRGTQIAEWMRDGPEMYGVDPIKSFCILDDSNDMDPFHPFLVQTQFAYGLQESKAREAIQMLNQEPSLGGILLPHNNSTL